MEEMMPSDRSPIPASRRRLLPPGVLGVLSAAMLAAALLAAAPVIPAIDARSADEPEAPAAAPEPLPALDAGRGLARAEAERKPILVIALARSAAGTYHAALAKSLRDSTRERLAEDFVVIEVRLGDDGAWPPSEPAGPAESPAPWGAERAKGFLEERLGRLGEAPVLAILDFCGTALARFDGEPPSESKLKKALRAATGANEKRARSFAEAQKLLEQLGLALKRKLHPEACRIYMTLRAIDLPLGTAPAIARAERFAELEAAFRERVAAAKELEDEDQFAQAVAELDRVLQEFPLPEWQDELRRKIGILWRKIYGRAPG